MLAGKGAMKSAAYRVVKPWRVVAFVIVAAAGFLLATMVDKTVFDRYADRTPPPSDVRLMFRTVGYLPFWLLVAAVFVLTDWPRLGREGLAAVLRRGYLLAMAVTCSALLSELLKLLIRRERPIYHAGEYVFRQWSGRTLNTAGLALPSGHATVAFGAAWMLCCLYPRATPIWLTAAIGCAAGRVLVGAHFASDVWLSAVISFVVVWGLWRVHGGKQSWAARSRG